MKTETLHRIALGVIIATVATLVLMGAGCGTMIPREQSQGAALATADKISSQQALTIQKAVRGSPPPNVTISGTNNTTYVSPGVALPPGFFGGAVKSEDLPAMAQSSYQEMTTVTSGTKQAAGSSETQSWYDAIKIPLGVKLALLAVGLAMLAAVVFAVIWFAKRNSAAAAAAFSAADSIVAQQIDRVHAKLAVASDPKQQAELAEEKAQLEKQRGKLGRK